MQKGAVTHVACGVTSSPPIASICIRANWKMPGVMNRYIKYEAAGDQYVGRCVSGHSRLGKGFAESLPYFDFSLFDPIVKEQMTKEVDDWIKARMPGGAALNESVFALFKACLSSLVFHRDWLNCSIHSENALRTSPFWSETIPHSEHVTTRYPWNKMNDTPEFTGLPVDVMYMAKVEKMQIELEAFKVALLQDNSRVVEEITNNVEMSLDRRSIGGERYGISVELNHKLDALLEKLSVPVTQTGTEPMDVDGMDDAFFCGGLEEDDDIIITVDEEKAMQEMVRDATIKAKTQQQLQNRRSHGLLVGFHHGVLNPLPSMWRYPKRMNLIQMITLYQMGSPSESVPPLKYISTKQVSHFDIDGASISRMRRVMKIVRHFDEFRNVWEPRNVPNYWNGETVTQLWNGIIEDIMPYLLTETKMGNDKPISYHKSKSASLAWRTCHDKLRSKGVFKHYGV